MYLNLVVETWFVDSTDEMSSMMMASSICALVFEYTSEEALLNRPDFNYSTLRTLYLLIARCLTSSEQVHCPFIINC